MRTTNTPAAPAAPAFVCRACGGAATAEDTIWVSPIRGLDGTSHSGRIFTRGVTVCGRCAWSFGPAI